MNDLSSRLRRKELRLKPMVNRSGSTKDMLGKNKHKYEEMTWKLHLTT